MSLVVLITLALAAAGAATSYYVIFWRCRETFEGPGVPEIRPRTARRIVSAEENFNFMEQELQRHQERHREQELQRHRDQVAVQQGGARAHQVELLHRINSCFHAFLNQGNAGD